MHRYKIDSIAKRILKWEDYEIFSHNHGVRSKLKEFSMEYRRPYFISRKNNSNEKYIVFRNELGNGGIWASFIKKYIFSAEWAYENGYIPMADIETKESFAKYSVGESNLFDVIFKQNCNIKELDNKKYVFVYATNQFVPSKKMCLDVNENQYIDTVVLKCDDMWRGYYLNLYKYIKKWLPLNDDFLSYFNGIRSSILSYNKKIIAVSIRTEFHKDYIDSMPKEYSSRGRRLHPMSDYIENCIGIIKEKMTLWDCDKIFLSTEFQDTVDLFENHFGDNVIYLERTGTNRLPYLEETAERCYKKIHGISIDEEIDDMYTNMPNTIRAYMSEILIQSNCDFFIGTKSGGAIMTMAFNGGKFKDVYFFEDFNNSKLY